MGNVPSQLAMNNIQVTEAPSSECTLSIHGDSSSNSGDLLSIPGESASNSGDSSSYCGDMLSSRGDSSQPSGSLNTPHCKLISRYTTLIMKEFHLIG